MNIYISRLLVLLLLLSATAEAGNRWHVILPGGNMQFKGEIIEEACSIALENKEMTVSMGLISGNNFHAAGAFSEPVHFDIQLQNCSTSVSQHVGISLHGVADSREPDLLAINNEQDHSSNIAIAFFDENERPIKLNHPPKFWKRIVDGPVTLHLLARYKAIQHPVMGGKANGQLWFFLTYE